MMFKSEANIEIKRKGQSLSVSVVMPIWTRQNDESISVQIPFFGLKTVAWNIDDIQVAVEEIVKCFCIASEKYGKGLEKELEEIGWILIRKRANKSLLDFSKTSENTIVEQIMETGELFAHHRLEMEFV